MLLVNRLLYRYNLLRTGGAINIHGKSQKESFMCGSRGGGGGAGGPDPPPEKSQKYRVS